MRSYNHGRFQQQASFLRRQFLQDGNLPFTNVLSEGIVAQALAAINVRWLDRIYSLTRCPSHGNSSGERDGFTALLERAPCLRL